MELMECQMGMEFSSVKRSPTEARTKQRKLIMPVEVVLLPVMRMKMTRKSSIVMMMTYHRLIMTGMAKSMLV